MFGGRTYVGESAKYLNDIMTFDEIENKWVEIKTKGPKPAGRYGHTMFCYYNYLVIFAGEGEN